MAAKKDKTLNEWRNATAKHTKHRAYQTKPPKFKTVTLPDGKVTMVHMPRKQPKKYPYASKKRGGVALWHGVEANEAA